MYSTLFNHIKLYSIIVVIPKGNTVFRLIWNEAAYEIHGNHFCTKSADRMTKKWKDRFTTNL
jgi:hypothetical protein